MAFYTRRIFTGELSSPETRSHFPAIKLPVVRSPDYYTHRRPATILSKSITTRIYVIDAAVESTPVFLRGRGGRRRFAVGDSVVEIDHDERRSSDERTVEVAVAGIGTVVLGVGNRVFYKLALVPLKNYPFFLAQLATFGGTNNEFRCAYQLSSCSQNLLCFGCQ